MVESQEPPEQKHSWAAPRHGLPEPCRKIHHPAAEQALDTSYPKTSPMKEFVAVLFHQKWAFDPSEWIFHPWNRFDHGTASWLSCSVSFFYQGHGSWNRNIGPDFSRQHFEWKTRGIQTKPRLSRVASRTSMTWWSTGFFPSGSTIFSHHSCRLLHVLKERHPQSRLTNIAPLNCEMLRFIPANSWPNR